MCGGTNVTFFCGTYSFCAFILILAFVLNVRVLFSFIFIYLYCLIAALTLVAQVAQVVYVKTINNEEICIKYLETFEREVAEKVEWFYYHYCKSTSGLCS